MRRRRVAVLMFARPEWGGSYQYARQLVKSLREAPRAFDLIVLGDEHAAAVAPGLSSSTTTSGRLWASLGRRLRGPARRLRFRAPPAVVGLARRGFRRWTRRHGIDLLVLCDHNPIGFESGLPFVMPIHDLLHRLFPEFADDADAAGREYCFRHAARTARKILVDSDVSREDVVRCYGARPERVCVLPFLQGIVTGERPPPARVADVRRRYVLPERYFFYPAQFWRHKNHARLARALRLMREPGALVLAGTAKTGTPEFERVVHELGLGPRIRVLGYVPDDDLAPLYAGAVALVMPTFNGPINIPIVEAWGLGVPVIASDLRGIREHVGDAALRVDPRDPAAIAAAMDRLWSDDALRRDLAERGLARAADYGEGDFTRIAVGAVEEALIR